MIKSKSKERTSQMLFDFDELDRQAKAMMEMLGVPPAPKSKPAPRVYYYDKNPFALMSHEMPYLNLRKAVLAFAEMVKRSAANAVGGGKNRLYECLTELEDLDYSQILDRWYALDVLCAYKCAPELYFSPAAAIQSAYSA